MKNSGIISVAVFVISLIVYATWFFSENLFSKSAMIIVVVLPIIGIIIALFEQKKSLKIVGIMGNSLLLLWTVVIPFASALLWNTP